MRKTRQLMSSFQLCLAHYCDLHGPTPLMVTEGLPASCTVCFEEGIDAADGRPRSSAHATGPTSHSSTALNEALNNLNLSRSSSVPASEQEAQAKRAALLRSSSAGAAATTSAIDTPPESPRPAPSQQSRRDSSFRRTYDETVTKKQGPCDNCAMTLPPRQQGGSNNVHFANNARGPTLRTRAPAERVFGPGGQASPPNSQTSSDTDGERDEDSRPRQRMTPSVSSRNTSRSSASASASAKSTGTGTSTAAERTPFHVHYVDYTSTHDPVLPDSFSLIRASCLRTLSFETLPRAPATATPTSPLSATSPAFVTTQSAGSAVTGGPIFFGDALAGYTTAYIFRIPDVHARGHKRVYAFLALSTHRERLAMKTFAVVAAAFRDLATWIQQLAEAEAERAAENSPIGSSIYGGGYAPQQSAVESTGGPDRGGSSFLTGGSGFTRRMGGGPGASAPKARGLAEIVGQPDIFIELHKRFVHLLFEVGVTLSS
ncbi:hypothetical protein ACJ41O_011496 [Fusarium nematophilum]